MGPWARSTKKSPVLLKNLASRKQVGGANEGSIKYPIWVVVSNIFYFHPYLGKISNLTNIFQMGWNHQPEKVMLRITWPSLKSNFIGCTVDPPQKSPTPNLVFCFFFVRHFLGWRFWGTKNVARHLMLVGMGRVGFFSPLRGGGTHQKKEKKEKHTPNVFGIPRPCCDFFVFPFVFGSLFLLMTCFFWRIIYSRLTVMFHPSQETDCFLVPQTTMKFHGCFCWIMSFKSLWQGNMCVSPLNHPFKKRFVFSSSRLGWWRQPFSGAKFSKASTFFPLTWRFLIPRYCMVVKTVMTGTSW